MDLQEAREIIADVDAQMASLFEKRMEAVRCIADYKKERGLPVMDAQQEEKVLRSQVDNVEDPELKSFYIQFLQGTMDVSKRYQHRLMDGIRVAYSGVEGAFAQIAAKKIFPEGSAITYPSFAEAYQAVVSGDCDAAVLPIENSYTGEIGQVVDLMFNGELYVNGVYDLSVTQNLLGMPDADMEDIKTVISHPQALGQCQGYIRRHGFEIRTSSNTALAARTVLEEGDRSVAAIASDQTADLYGLKILDHDINEEKVNITRFAVFSRVDHIPSVEGKDNSAFILFFTVNDEAGALAKAINVIGAYDFNMRMLRSRPMKNLTWHYYFYVEVEGDDQTANGRQMLNALRHICPVLKVAGRYTSKGSIVQGGEMI